MPFEACSFTRRFVFIAAGVSLFVALSGLIVGVRARLLSGSEDKPATVAVAGRDSSAGTEVPAHSAKGQPLSADNPQRLAPGSRGPVQIVRFTLYDAGIFPREARASTGLVAIHMEDVSGDSAGVVVEGEARQTIGQIVRGRHQWRAKSRLSLGPGRYQVYDASRPKNRATLIVEP